MERGSQGKRRVSCKNFSPHQILQQIGNQQYREIVRKQDAWKRHEIPTPVQDGWLRAWWLQAQESRAPKTGDTAICKKTRSLPWRRVHAGYTEAKSRTVDKKSANSKRENWVQQSSVKSTAEKRRSVVSDFFCGRQASKQLAFYAPSVRTGYAGNQKEKRVEEFYNGHAHRSPDTIRPDLRPARMEQEGRDNTTVIVVKWVSAREYRQPAGEQQYAVEASWQCARFFSQRVLLYSTNKSSFLYIGAKGSTLECRPINK